MIVENRIALAGEDRFTIPRRLMLVALTGIIALTLGACGTGDASDPATASEGDGPSVVIEDLAFEPETLTVEAGDTVTWTWNDGAVTHDVSGDDFQSEVISEGTFQHRFDESGTYDYVCTLHPNMTGTIEVNK
ncbi:MAG TPA: plastocyanin/azurin family copper-binding protein [Actinomycetota bacterium]|nr:plastocyanin/azurin family copper-binding protein [Actinomycetota bacterium]